MNYFIVLLFLRIRTRHTGTSDSTVPDTRHGRAVPPSLWTLRPTFSSPPYGWSYRRALRTCWRIRTGQRRPWQTSWSSPPLRKLTENRPVSSSYKDPWRSSYRILLCKILYNNIIILCAHATCMRRRCAVNSTAV